MNSLRTNLYENFDPMPLDLQGWNGHSEVFKNLINQTSPSIIIEVGTWKGQSAINMATYVKQLNLQTTLYCVDTWLGALEFWTNLSHTPERDLFLKNGYPQVYYQFLSNVIHSNVQDIIVPFPTTSLIAARYFNYHNIKAQLIYIDASHDKEDVLLDLKNYYNILEPNGIIFGDDIHWTGVNEAVHEFTAEKGLKFEILENNFWIIK